MTETADLDALERGVFRSLFEDGLFDIGLGLWLVVWSPFLDQDRAALGGVFMAVIVFLWYLAHARITEPRLGTVRFRAASRAARLRAFVLALTLTMLVGVFLVVSRGSLPRALEAAISAQSHLLLGAALSFLLLALAGIFRVGRLLAYAGLLLLLFALGPPLGLPFPYSMAAGGALILASGALILVRFLRDHPTVEISHGG